jgi:hypothetical protein
MLKNKQYIVATQPKECEMADTIATFRQAVRNRRVYQITSRYWPNYPIFLDQQLVQQNWAIPSFYFGYMFDMNEPDFVGLQALNNAVASAQAGQFRLPYPECLFLIGNGNRSEECFIVCRLTEVSGGIAVQAYRPENAGYWGKHPDDIFFSHFGMVSHNFDRRIGGQPDVLEFSDFVRICVFAGLEFLLAPPVGVSQTSTTISLGGTSRQRKATSGNGQIKDSVIHINRVAYQAALSVGSGSPKSPHMRRGHWRTLPNGNVTWIEPMAIKGGNAPTDYSVVE